MNDPREDSPFFPGNAAIKHPHLLYADLISPTISFNPPRPIPQFGYHFTSKSNLESIMATGLRKPFLFYPDADYEAWVRSGQIDGVFEGDNPDTTTAEFKKKLSDLVMLKVRFDESEFVPAPYETGDLHDEFYLNSDVSPENISVVRNAISFNPPVTVQPRKVSPTKKGRFVMEGEDVTNHYAFFPVISAGAYDPLTGKISDGKPELYVNATKANAWQIRSHEDNMGDARTDEQGYNLPDLSYWPLGNLVRINMFRRTAGFKVLKNGKPIKNQPEYIISAETGGKHYYALTAIRAVYGILANFPSKKSEPRLRIETRGVMTKTGASQSPPEPLADSSLSVRGKVHPLYDSFWISPLNEDMDWIKNPLVPLEEMMPEQIIVSLSGPSGMGKSTIQKALKKLFGNKASIAPTYTTRKKRKNEKQGIDIKTVSQAKFDKMREAGDFTSANGTDLVFENYGDKYARRIQDLTATPIVIIDQSFDALKKMRSAEIADIFSIFLLLDKPREEWEYIIKSRGEPQWKVERRIKSGEKMMKNYKDMNFDLKIKNKTGEIKKTVSKIHSKIISKMAITNPPAMSVPGEWYWYATHEGCKKPKAQLVAKWDSIDPSWILSGTGKREKLDKKTYTCESCGEEVTRAPVAKRTVAKDGWAQKSYNGFINYHMRYVPTTKSNPPTEGVKWEVKYTPYENVRQTREGLSGSNLHIKGLHPDGKTEINMGIAVYELGKRFKKVSLPNGKEKYLTKGIDPIDGTIGYKFSNSAIARYGWIQKQGFNDFGYIQGIGVSDPDVHTLDVRMDEREGEPIHGGAGKGMGQAAYLYAAKLLAKRRMPLVSTNPSKSATRAWSKIEANLPPNYQYREMTSENMLSREKIDLVGRLLWYEPIKANPPKAHVVIDGSPKKDKKLRAVFSFSDGRKKTTHFGDKNYSDYTIHNDPERKKRYGSRHSKGEDWEDFTTAGALSKWILWNKPSLKKSFDHYLAMFSLTGELKVKTSLSGPIPASRNPMAPGYQSFSWISQDWRSVKVNNKGEIDYSEKCGAEGTQTKSGKPRLCLPRKVIQTLLKSESGKEVLRQQARKKARAEKGERIPWHPRIKKLHAKLEKETVQDNPARMNPPMFSIRFEDIPKRSPPANKATMEELKVVMRFYKNKKVPEHLQDDAEKIIPLFTNYMRDARLPFDQKVAKETISTLKPLIVEMKHYYARARPKEFAKHHGIDFNPKFVESAQTPEYPSGHAIQAYVLAHLLGKANPEHKKQLLSLADIVSQSRIDIGVHYPSSVIYSRDISPIIAKSFLYENPISPFQSGIAILPRQEDQGRKVFYQPSPSKSEAEWMIFAVGYTSTTAAKDDLAKFTEAAKKHLTVPFEIKNKKRYNYALHKGAKIGTTHPKTGGPKSQGQAIQTRKSDEGETIFTADTLLGESWRNPLKTFNIKGQGMGNVIRGQLIRELEAKGHKISDTGNVYLEILGFNHPKKGAPDLIVSSPESMGPSHQLIAQRVALFLSENSELEIMTDTVDDLDPLGNRLMYHGQKGVALAVFINKASDIHKHYKEISKSLADAIEISVNPPEGMLIQSYTLTIPVSFYDTSLAFFELEELGYEWKGENLERSWYSLKTRFGGKSTLHIRPHISYLYSAHQLSEKEQGLVRDDVIKVAEKIQAKKPKHNPAVVKRDHLPPQSLKALERKKNEGVKGRFPDDLMEELRQGNTTRFNKWIDDNKGKEPQPPRQKQDQQGQRIQPPRQKQQDQQQKKDGQPEQKKGKTKIKNVFSVGSRELIKGLTGRKHPESKWDKFGKKQQGKKQQGKNQQKGKNKGKKNNNRKPKKNPIEEDRCSCGALPWVKPDPKFGDTDHESYILPPPGYCRCSSIGVGPGNPAKGHEGDYAMREKFREYYSDGRPVAFPWEPGYKPPRKNPIKLNPVELDRDGVEYIEDFGMTMNKKEERKKFKSVKLKGPIGSEALFLQLAEQVQDFGEASGWIKGDRLYFRPGARHLNEAAVSGYIMEGATAFFHTHPRVWEPSQTSPDDFKVYHGLFTIHGIQDHFTVMGDRIDWFHFAKSNRLKIDEVANVIIDFEKDIEEVFQESEQEHIRKTDGHAHLRDRTQDIVDGLNEKIPEYQVRFKCFLMSPEQIRSTKR